MKRWWVLAMLIVSSGLLSAVTACGNLPKPTMKRVDATSILVADSRFAQDPAARFATPTHCGYRESAVWNGETGRAEIYVSHADEGCVIYTPLVPEDELALKFKWLRRTGVQFQEQRSATDTALGTVWGRRFTRGDRDCYFFRHAFEAHHFSFYSDPTTWMVGYYCEPAGTTIDEASIRQFVTSISLSERRPETKEIAPARRSGTTVASTLAPNQKFDRAVVPSSRPPARDVVYSLSGKWAGTADSVTGKFFYERRGTTGKFELRMSADGAVCQGNWKRTKYDLDGFTMGGRWRIECPNVPTGSGTFRYRSERYAEMSGADEMGNHIHFSLRAFDSKIATTVPSGRRVPFAWEGVSSTGAVIVAYERFEGPGSLSFADSDGIVDCKGGWYLDGRWSADCSNGRKLAGKSFRFQHGTILGTGTDDLGRHFRFGES